jgi:hypothetical protein
MRINLEVRFDVQEDDPGNEELAREIVCFKADRFASTVRDRLEARGMAIDSFSVEQPPVDYPVINPRTEQPGSPTWPDPSRVGGSNRHDRRCATHPTHRLRDDVPAWESLG